MPCAQNDETGRRVADSIQDWQAPDLVVWLSPLALSVLLLLLLPHLQTNGEGCTCH